MVLQEVISSNLAVVYQSFGGTSFTEL